MTTYLVTEGPHDAELLQRVLNRVVPQEAVSIVVAGGKASASSVARSLLARGSEAVVLVVDADTRDQQLIAAQRNDLEAALGMAGPARSYRILLLVPELEALLLRDDVWRETGRSALSASDTELARYAPREVLARIMGGDRRAELIRSLPDGALDRLASAPELEPLIDFVVRRAA